MKKYCSLLFLFLGLFVQTSYAQISPSATGSGPIIPTSDNLGYVLMQSRAYPYKLVPDKLQIDSLRYVAEPFALGKPLYPVLEKNRSQANAVSLRAGGEVKLFWFAKSIPGTLTMSTLRAIEAATQTRQATLRRVAESNPIYLSDDAYSITVLRAGVFVYRTVAFGGQMVTMLTAPTDDVPKKPYYFDFRERNPLSSTPICYDTTIVKQISLTYKGSGQTVSHQKPQLESFWFENADRHRPLMGIKAGNADEGFTDPVGYLNILFNGDQIQYIKGRKGQLRLYYKLRGIPTPFALNVLILFGCLPRKTPPLPTHIIYPTDPNTGSRMADDEAGQPDPTQVGVRPPQN